MIDELYTQVRLFFSLPDETKAKYEIPGSGQRGYTSLEKSTPKVKPLVTKEFFHFGQNNPTTNGEDYPENVLVDENPALTCWSKNFFSTRKNRSFRLRALALHLGLEEFYFDPYVKVK